MFVNNLRPFHMLKLHLKHLLEEIFVKLYQNISKKCIIAFFWNSVWCSAIPEFLVLDVKQQDYIRSLQTVVISVKLNVL